ncbi:MAG: polysaccharide biosynthesis C-terminal domain-containing protein, partial [Gemmatimonadales bacterium]
MPADEVTGSGPEILSLRLLARQALRYLPGTLAPLLVSLLASRTFTTWFEPGDYGHYVLAASLGMLTAALGSQWLQQAINRFLSAATDPGVARDLLGAIAVALGAVAAVFCVTLAPPIALGRGFLPARWQPFLWAGAAQALVLALHGSLMVVLQARMRPGWYSTFSALYVALGFGAAILLVVAGYRHPAAILWGGVIAGALLLPVIWWKAGLPAFGWLRSHRQELRGWVGQLFHYGAPMTGWYLAAVLLSIGDRFLIGMLRGSAEVGVYAANYSLSAGLAGLVSAPVVLAAHPFLMRAWGDGDLDQAGEWLGKITALYLLGGALVVGWGAVFAGDLASLALALPFREGHGVIAPVLAGVVLWQTAMYTHKPFEFAGRTRGLVLLGLAALGVNLALNALLIPIYGYVAAAWTTLASYAFYVALTTWRGRRILRWSFPWRPTIAPFTITLVGLAAAGAAHRGLTQALGPAGSTGVAALLALGTTLV